MLARGSAESMFHSMFVALVATSLSRALGVGRLAGMRVVEREEYVGGHEQSIRLRRSDGISSMDWGVFEPASGGFARLSRRHRVDHRLSAIQSDAIGIENASANASAAEASENQRSTVWIAGWPRSGSTTMFEMVLAGARSPSIAEGGNFLSRAAATQRHFGLFEPCHWGLGDTTPPDRYVPELEGHCGKVMDRLVQCNFTGVDFLFGWSKYGGTHTDISGVDDKKDPYAPDFARRVCSSSDLVVYKTVQDFGRSIDNLLPILDAHPLLQVIVPVRDPRGIAASWEKRPWGAKGVGLLLSICKQHKANMYQKHPRLRRVVFENLASQPVPVMEGVFKFLNLDFGKTQTSWIRQTFNATCAGRGTGPFSTCHKDSQAPLRKWRTQLTRDELQAFKRDPDCRAVAKQYGYPLE